jgi:hypothetical protein
VLIAPGVGAQGSQRERIAPIYQVVASRQTVRLDGKLSEGIWGSVDSIVDFRQREPRTRGPIVMLEPRLHSRRAASEFGEATLTHDPAE